MKNSSSNKLTICGIILLLLLNTIGAIAQLRIGDTGVSFDNSKNDSQYPYMQEWQKSGVKGGIPLRSSIPVKLSIHPTDSDGLQRAINSLNTNGELSVILLKAGVYVIDKPISLKSNIVLRGEDKDLVRLNVTVRSRGDNSTQAIILKDIASSGLEDLTFEYLPPKSITIYDDRNVPLNSYCGSKCFGNDPDGVRNMYVSFVRMNGSTKNCWVDNCNFKNAGSDPLEIWANHNTFRDNFVDACFNKGGGGNGYYDIRGDYNLFVNEKVRRIRHFTIQNGAKYNVVLNCDIEVDVNFHNGDDGFNLIEGNKIVSLRWRSWSAFATGGSRYGHDRPGRNNIIFNNNVLKGRGDSDKYGGDDKVFVFDQYSNPRLLRDTPPSGGTFYPVILDGDTDSNEGDGNEGECQDFQVTEVAVFQDAYLQKGKLYNNDDLRVENDSRISYLQFKIPSEIENITKVELNMTVSTDPGSGLVEIYKGTITNWTENTLSELNKPIADKKIGSLNTTYEQGQVYDWILSDVSAGDTLNLIIKQADGNDVSFASKEGDSSPRLIITQQCDQKDNNSISSKVTRNDHLKVYPNPVDNEFQLLGVNNGDIIKVYDVSGKLLRKMVALQYKQFKINISELKKGIYFLSVADRKKVKLVKR